MKRIAIFLMVLFICVVPVRAVAQLCNIIPETITTYPKQAFGNYNLWDASYGDVETVETVAHGLAIDSKHIMLVGGVQYETGQHGTLDYGTLVLTKIDRRGRKVLEQRHELADRLSAIKTVLRDGDHFWVMGDARNDIGQYHVWIGQFDLEANMVSQKIISDPDFNIRAGDMVFAHETGDENSARYVVGVNIQKYISPSSGSKYEERQSREAFRSRLYFVDKALKTLNTRTYALGINNQIFDMEPLEGGAYALTGQVKAANNLQSGWLMIVSREGGITWQREFSRGSFSRLNSVSSYLNDHVIVGGFVHSAHKKTPPIMIEDGQRKTDAAWVMAVSVASGEIVWQRYFASDFDYAVRDLHTIDDGMIHAVIQSGGLDIFDLSEDEIQAQIKDNASPDFQHAVMVSLSPRGVILNKASFFDGMGVVPSSLFLFDDKYPMIVGQSVTTTFKGPENEDGEPTAQYSPDGWAMMGGALSPYEDPCR